MSYRGHSSANWQLVPSLCRQNLTVDMLKQIENEVIQQFRDRFDLSGWTSAEVLAYARHHGAPTRLLDWSTNPFVGLWFAICDKMHDSSDGMVYQLIIPSEPSKLIIGVCFQLEKSDPCPCKHPIHVFTSPARIDRTNRQRSVFSIGSFEDECALRPLDEVVNQEAQKPIRKFRVPFQIKSELRRLLSDLALDAYSIYGDPDSFGKAMAVHFDMSDLKIEPTTPSDHIGKEQGPRTTAP